MRTKSIILGAALLAAGVATSMAQVTNVFSVNVVGYVNVTVQSNKFYLIQNPLDDGAGDIVTNVMPLNDTWDSSSFPGGFGSLILKFSGGAVSPVETYFQGFGWYPGTNQIPPGTGFYLYPATNATVTFAGSVITNHGVNLVAGFQLVGSAYLAATDITTLGLNGTNNVGPNGDLLLRYQNPGGLNDISTFFSGYGWYETTNNVGVMGGSGGPTNGPTLNVAEGFFYYVAPGNTSFQWNQNFSIH